MISHISYSGKYQVVHFVLKIQQLSPYKEEALPSAQTLPPHHREQPLVEGLRPHLQAMLQRPLPLRKQFVVQVVVQPGRLNPSRETQSVAWRIRTGGSGICTGHGAALQKTARMKRLAWC